MGVLDDYEYQLRTKLRKNITSMSSGEMYAAQNKLKGLQAQNREKQTPRKKNNHAGSSTPRKNNNNSGASTQHFREAEQQSLDKYEVYKMIKDAMERMLNTGHEIDEATLEAEIPEAMLRDNPDMLDDIAKQVADEMADRGRLNDEYDVDVTAEGGKSECENHNKEELEGEDIINSEVYQETLEKYSFTPEEVVADTKTWAEIIADMNDQKILYNPLLDRFHHTLASVSLYPWLADLFEHPLQLALEETEKEIIDRVPETFPISNEEINTIYKHPFFAKNKLRQNYYYTDGSVKLYFGKMEDGRSSNAFRHALFTALNTLDSNSRTASQFANAHENLPANVTDQTATADISNYDHTQMDLHNNAVGIAIAKSIIKSGKRKDMTDDELAALVYNIIIEEEEGIWLY